MYAKRIISPPPEAERTLIVPNARLESLIDFDASEFRLRCELPASVPLAAVAQCFQIGGEFAGIARMEIFPKAASVTTTQISSRFSRIWWCDAPGLERHIVSTVFRTEPDKCLWEVTIRCTQLNDSELLGYRMEAWLGTLRGILGVESTEFLRTQRWAEAKAWGETSALASTPSTSCLSMKLVSESSAMATAMHDGPRLALAQLIQRTLLSERRLQRFRRWSFSPVLRPRATLPNFASG